jgi:endonuclease-3
LGRGKSKDSPENTSSSGRKQSLASRSGVKKVDNLLLSCYGDKAWSPHFSDLLDSLIQTVLSQNTNDTNSHRAFSELKRRFPTWEAAGRASTGQIEKAIRSGGISRVKAERIKTILEIIKHENGSYSLEGLRDMPPAAARDYLEELPGVGPKTAAVILLFSLSYPFFPVDTHIYRVTGRLGIIPAKTSVAKAHEIMDRLVPDDKKYRLHINLIEHGRRTCVARKPKCPLCCLNKICPRIGVKEVDGNNA